MLRLLNLGVVVRPAIGAALTFMLAAPVAAEAQFLIMANPAAAATAGEVLTGAAGGTVINSRIQASQGALRPVGSILQSVDDVMANPSLLAGKSPALVQTILQKTPGWKVETLAKGSKAGQGFVFREYSKRGNPTGQMIRWHPGGGHHGPDPYWRVTSHTLGKSEVIR